MMAKKKKDRLLDEELIEEDQDQDKHESGACQNQTESLSEGRSLYEVLGVDRTASQQEIKKAYYKLPLRLHPDKNPGDEEAKDKFQQLQKVISILGYEEKISIYDQTGFVDDADLGGDTIQNLREYFKAIYKEVAICGYLPCPIS